MRWFHFGRRFAVALLGCTHLGESALAGPHAQDLTFAKNDYVLKSSGFTPQAREQAIAFIARATPSADEMSPQQFLLCMLRISALADNGHDVVNVGEGAWFPDARLPIRMVWFRDNWVVARADSVHRDLVGARVLRVEHKSSAAIFRKTRDLFGGSEPYRRWNVEPLIENAGILYALGLASKPDRLTLDLLLGNRRVTRTLWFVQKSELPPGQAPQRVWSPASWPGEREHGWTAVNPEPTPLYLQQGERSFRVLRLREIDSLYLQMRTHFDTPEESIAGFQREADEAITRFHPVNLIVDLRFDSGGDIDLTREWQRTLPTRIPGGIYVLVGPYTFSAGIIAAAALKHDARNRARIVGDDVGDRLSWWSEGSDVCAPNSKYCLHLTTGLWDLVHGCSGRPQCYGDKYDAQIESLQPDVHAPLVAEAFLAGRDPGMEAVKREIARRQGSDRKEGSGAP